MHNPSDEHTQNWQKVNMHAQKTHDPEGQNGETPKIGDTTASEDRPSRVVFPVSSGIRVVQLVVGFGTVGGTHVGIP